jgi:hypothetical protein
MNLATDYHFFGVSQPVSPAENQVFQQCLSLAVPNGFPLAVLVKSISGHEDMKMGL